MPTNKVLNYGRFQPPSNGHVLVYHKVLQLAHKHNAKGYILTSTTHDSKKNPLDPDTKVKFLRKMFKGVTVDKCPGGFIEALIRVSPADKLIIVVGGDRVADIERLANKYNHVHYDFGEIELVNAGDRRGAISATIMRQFAKDNDFESFERNLDKSKLTHDEIKQLFELTRKGLQVT